jgi:hypothetical protein
MAGSDNFTGQKIQDTYQRVLQISSSGELADGTGSLVPLLEVTASHAVSASVEITHELSSSHAQTADTGSYILASNIDQPFTNITASGDISARRIIVTGSNGVAGIISASLPASHLGITEASRFGHIYFNGKNKDRITLEDGTGNIHDGARIQGAGVLGTIYDIISPGTNHFLIGSDASGINTQISGSNINMLTAGNISLFPKGGEVRLYDDQTFVFRFKNDERAFSAEDNDRFELQANLTASGDISASGNINASQYLIQGNKFGGLKTGTTDIFNIGNAGAGSLNLTNVTASGDISASTVITTDLKGTGDTTGLEVGGYISASGATSVISGMTLSASGDLHIGNDADIKGDLTVVGIVSASSTATSSFAHAKVNKNLDVAGDTNITGETFLQDDMTVANGWNLRDNNGNSILYLSGNAGLYILGRTIRTNDTNGIKFGADSDYRIMHANSPERLLFQYGASTKLTMSASIFGFSSDSKVGIGTTTAGTELEVVGDISASGDNHVFGGTTFIGTTTSEMGTGQILVVGAQDGAQIKLFSRSSATNRDVGFHMSASSNGQEFSIGLARDRNTFYISPSNVGTGPDNTVFEIDASGNITASGDISSSGDIIAKAGTGSFGYVEVYGSISASGTTFAANSVLADEIQVTDDLRVDGGNIYMGGGGTISATTAGSSFTNRGAITLSNSTSTNSQASINAGGKPAAGGDSDRKSVV